MRIAGLFVLPFLALIFISRPWFDLSYFLTWCVLISAIQALITSGIILLLIRGLSKKNPAGNKTQMDGLIGGSIISLIAAIAIFTHMVLVPDKALTLSEFFNFFSLFPTVLIAAYSAANKLEGAIIGFLVYFLFFPSLLFWSIPPI